MIMKLILLILISFVTFSCNSGDRTRDNNNVTVEYSNKKLQISEKLKWIVQNFVDSSKQKVVHRKIFIDRYSLDQANIVITSECDSISNKYYDEPILVIKYKQSKFDVFTGSEYHFLRNEFKSNPNYQLNSPRIESYIDSVDDIRYLGNLANPFVNYVELIYTGESK